MGQVEGEAEQSKAVAGHGVKLCRGHLAGLHTALLLCSVVLSSTIGLYWNEKRIIVICDKSH